MSAVSLRAEARKETARISLPTKVDGVRIYQLDFLDFFKDLRTFDI